MGISASDAWNYLNAIESVLTALAERGIARDRALELLRDHEGGDITTDDVQSFLDETGTELTDTQLQILDKMTVAELRDFATDKKIEIPADVTKKADIKKHIAEHVNDD